MKRIASWLCALLLGCGVVLAVAPEARADASDGWNFSRWDMDVTVQPNGDARVLLDVDLDFGNREQGHGPFFYFVNRQRVPGDPDHWYVIDTSLTSSKSSTGANVELDTDTEDQQVIFRLGDKDKSYSGVQSYQIELSLHGIVDQDNAESGLDEVNWTAIGVGSELPINNPRITLHGPVDATRASCFTGSDLRTGCTASVDGDQAVFSDDRLEPGEGIQVVAGYPVGTFHDAEPRLIKRLHFGNTFPLNPANIAGVVGVAATAIVALVAGVRRFGRDRVYVGLTPGLVPAPGDRVATGVRRSKLPVTVQFSPPAGVQPGELGLVMDGSVNTRDVTATIIDLAVRGHMRIERLDDEQWAFHRVESTSPLAAYEEVLLDQFGAVGTSITTEDLRDEKYATLISKTKTKLTDVGVKRGWFRGKLSLRKFGAFGLGLLITLIGVALTAGLAMAGLGWWGVPVVMAGLALMVLAFGFTARTPDGSAVLAQGRGFKQYLTTTEADRLKWEEGEDIFSKYLPYAIIFGCADRWTSVFTELAQQGRYSFDGIGWYYGYGVTPGHVAGLSTMGSDLSAMTSTLDSSMAHAVSSANSSSAGSSSGFSGGGGFGGGGSGAW